MRQIGAFQRLRRDRARLRGHRILRIVSKRHSLIMHGITPLKDSTWPLSLAHFALEVERSWDLWKYWHKLFLKCESSCGLMVVSVSMYDRKTEARPFDSIHDKLRLFEKISLTIKFSARFLKSIGAVSSLYPCVSFLSLFSQVLALVLQIIWCCENISWAIIFYLSTISIIFRWHYRYSKINENMVQSSEFR